MPTLPKVTLTIAKATLTLALAAATSSACAPDPSMIEIPSEELAHGGLYIAYNSKFPECVRGCDALRKGDLILTIAGQPVETRRDPAVHHLFTGKPIVLMVQTADDPLGTTMEVHFASTASRQLPPLKSAPPLWLVGAAELDRAPLWARRPLFGHASPALQLTSINGRHLNGRTLVGERRFMVFCTHRNREEERDCAEVMRVVQLGLVDLERTGVDPIFVLGGYTDSRRREFQQAYGNAQLSPVPMYGGLDLATNAVRALGVEGGTRYADFIHDPLTIVILDEAGIVRWHTAGLAERPPERESMTDAQYTAAAAVQFAITAL